MKLFATVAELTKAQESLGAMELRATTAEAAVADFTKQVDELTAQVGALTSERDALKAAQLAADAKIVDLTAKLAVKEGEVSTAREGVAKQVAAQAAATVASLGHATVSGFNGSVDALAEYAAEEDPVKRAQIFRKNKTAFRAAFRPTVN